MTEAAGVGRQLKAKYAFGGVTVEMDRTVPPDEPVLFHGAMRLRSGGLLPRPAVLRVTPRRLIILGHYALRSDQVWELPRGAVQSVGLVGRSVHISWTGEHGAVGSVKLNRWTGRMAPDRPVRDTAKAARILEEWLRSSDGDSGLPGGPHSHRQR